MKKNIILICLMAFLSITAFSQNFDFGFGLTSGTKMKITETGTKAGFGANVRGVFNFAHKFGIAGGISYYLPSKFNDGTNEYKNSFLLFNVDFLYYLMNVPKIKVYGLGGFVYTNNIGKINGMSHNSNFKGFALGAGAKIGPLFGELKYETKVKQVIATIGIYIK